MERYLWGLAHMNLFTSYELDLQSRLVNIHYTVLEYMHEFGETAPKDVSSVQQAVAGWKTVQKELEFLVYADLLGDYLNAQL